MKNQKRIIWGILIILGLSTAVWFWRQNNDNHNNDTEVINNAPIILYRLMAGDGTDFVKTCSFVASKDSLDRDQKIHYLQTHISEDIFNKYAQVFNENPSLNCAVLASELSTYNNVHPEEWELLISRWSVLYPENPMIKAIYPDIDKSTK